jgi:SAM-dependent methyltransferase
MQHSQFLLHAEIETRHWWFVARRRIICRLVEAVAPPSPATCIIDIGCGTGANLAALATRYACTGIDAAAAAIALARTRYPRVQFLHGESPRDCSASLARADVVLLLDVLEHVADDFLFFSENLAAIKPGAHVLLSVPAHAALWTEHDVSFGHYRRYDRGRLAQVWRGLPVQVCLLSFYNSRLYPVVRAIRTLNRWRGRAAGRAGTDFAMPPAPLNRLLAHLFVGEALRLVQALHNPARSYPQGVSLIALLRREAGAVVPRGKPADVAPDQHHPQPTVA